MAVDQTRDRIVDAALKILLARGVSKTSLTDVAYEAGVTRVTVHRYCGDKRGLIRAIVMKIAAIFQTAALGEPSDSFEAIDGRVDGLGRQLAALPKQNLLERLEEVNRVYPEIYAEFRAAQRAAVDRIFYQVLAAATRDQSLRSEVNPEVLKAIFWASTVGLLENPTLISSNVSLDEIVTTVSEVFRHGILKSEANGGD